MANSTVYPYGTNGELPSSIGIINDRKTGGVDKALSAQQGVEIGKIIDPKEVLNITFDGGNYYIDRANNGARTWSSDWISTKYIPVQEGDQFYYTGKPGSVSFGVAGYTYDGTTYTYVKCLVDANANSMRTDEYIYIPSGIDYILACDKKSGSASLTKVVQSTLSQLQEDLGTVGGLTYKPYSLYTAGHYVSSSGSWESNTYYRYLMIDVVPGDTIELYDVQINATNVALLAKKITASSFVPLLVPESTGTIDVSYSVQEEMTICISVVHKASDPAETSPRITLVRYNKMSRLDNAETLLATTRQEIADKDAEENVLDMQLGHLFEKIAVIGDSMSRGTLSSTSDDEVSTNSFGASWLSFLAKRWVCKGKFHYANSGTSCYTWLNNSIYGLGRMLKDTTIYNAYFIAYGHNDSASVGSASDTAAPVTITESGGEYTTSCPDGYSFCAYYKAIIDQIRTKAPHAMIFCLSEYDGVMVSSKPTYRQAVIDVANAYYTGGDTLVHHLETGGVNGSGGGMDLGTHYSTVGYAYIAKRVDEEAGKCVYQHRTDSAIKYFGGYNTDKTADSPLE